MNQLIAALLAGALAFLPLAGFAQDKPADKKAASSEAPEKKASAKKSADKKQPAEKKKRKKVGGCG